MKNLFALALFIAAFATAAFAQTSVQPVFPGVQAIMTQEEFARAGLSALTPDQLELINNAITRHYTSTVATVASRQAAVIVRQKTAAAAAQSNRSFLDRFGMPDFSADWRTLPVLKARCVGWVGGNSFKLDNGQVWEGYDTILVELAGRQVEIQPRPGAAFALVVDGQNTTMRVHRIK
jgi:hypothetical protein